jgi:hypothetical protein
MQAGAGLGNAAGEKSHPTTAKQRLRRDACPQTVRLYGKGRQQSIKRCMAAS